MRKTKLGQALIRGLRDVIAYEKGKGELRTSHLEIPGPAPVWSKKAIAKIRKERFKVSQPVFAALLSVRPATIKAWEQGLKHPSGAASRLIQILSKQPDLLKGLGRH
ncbi:MAG: transcriptional regulator [Deltaproteobacteria bacterium]|nr:transcriptional regulator [Deltaproteobacteria bacterium]